MVKWCFWGPVAAEARPGALFVKLQGAVLRSRGGPGCLLATQKWEKSSFLASTSFSSKSLISHRKVTFLDPWGRPWGRQLAPENSPRASRECKLAAKRCSFLASKIKSKKWLIFVSEKSAKTHSAAGGQGCTRGGGDKLPESSRGARSTAAALAGLKATAMPPTPQKHVFYWVFLIFFKFWKLLFFGFWPP